MNSPRGTSARAHLAAVHHHAFPLDLTERPLRIDAPPRREWRLNIIQRRCSSYEWRSRGSEWTCVERRSEWRCRGCEDGAGESAAIEIYRSGSESWCELHHCERVPVFEFILILYRFSSPLQTRRSLLRAMAGLDPISMRSILRVGLRQPIS